MLRQLRKYVYKTKFLSELLEETEEKHKAAQTDFLREVADLHIKLNVYDEALDAQFNPDHKPRTNIHAQPSCDPGFENKDSHSSHKIPSKESVAERSQNKKTTHPQWAKKVYRSITVKTHPDKLSSLQAEERLEKTKIYTKTTEAYAKGNYALIVVIAVDLNLTLPNDKEVLEILISKCRDLELEIKSLHDTLFWTWHHSDENQKKEILNRFVQERGWTRPNASIRKSRKDSKPSKGIAWLRKKLN